MNDRKIFELKKRNLILSDCEICDHWQPPAFAQSGSFFEMLITLLRRFFDLPAASIWKDLKKILPNVSGNVIDIGCGAQPYRQLFSSSVKYTGLDTVDSSDHFGYRLENVVVFEKEKAFPLENNSMDFVLCTEVLEHVFDVQFFLEEVNRVLNEHGKICFTVPFSARWHYIPFDYWRFTPSSLKEILENTGYCNVKIYARGNPLTVMCYKISSLIMPFMMPQDKNFFVKRFKNLIGIFLFPIFMIISCVGFYSLKFDWGDDCLGYTILAEKK